METELIGNLIDLIRREEALLGDFLGLLEEQKSLLVKNEVEPFEATVARQEVLLAQIREVEEERVRQVHRIAKDFELKESELTITRLVEISLGEVSNELKAAKRNLSGLVGRIKRANQVNQYLIQRSLNIGQRTLGMLIDDSLRDVTYEPNGSIRGQDRRSLVINKTL